MRFVTYSDIMPLRIYLQCHHCENWRQQSCNEEKKLSVTCFSNERILYQDVSTLNDSDHTYQDWWLEMEIKWQRIYLSKISWFHQDIDSTKIQVFTFYPDKRRIHDSIQFGKVGLDPKDWQINWESSSLNMFNILFNFKFTFSHRK